MAITKETRRVSGFSEVVLRGYGKLTVEQNPGLDDQESIDIEADEYILTRIVSEVVGRRPTQ